MRIRTQILLVPLFLAAAFAPAQQQPPSFSHVVIIFQENRTPDNIFGSAPAQTNCTQRTPSSRMLTSSMAGSI
jgi:phospholipase C